MIRVFVVDDEMLVRQGLCKLLELDGEIQLVGDAADGAAVIAAIPGQQIDVLLLDVRMPRFSGIEVLAELRRRQVLPPTLILTTFDDAELLLQSVRNGARGFLQKDVSLEQLLAAIRTVARGDTWFQPALTAALQRGSDAVSTPFESNDIVTRLTDREREVLRLMAAGHSNREIATALDTAEGTVKNQVSSILSKFGVRDRTRAVLKAIESGLL